MNVSLHSFGYFRDQSCRFGVVRVMFGFPNRVALLGLRAWRASLESPEKPYVKV